MESLHSQRLATLGHPQRLAIFRLLMRRYPGQVAAGEIAGALGVKPSTLSAYLSSLTQAGLVTQTRSGTSLRYAIAMEAVRDSIGYLMFDCCRGRPEICLTPFPDSTKGDQPMSDPKYAVLFICTGNSARSIFAESILREEAGDRFIAYSAGTKPYSELNPIAVEMLRQKGHDVSALRSKNVSEFQGPDAPGLDFVITVCDAAANEECPAWEGQPITGHWGVPDPVKAEGTEAQRRLAFQHAFGALRNRIIAFAALPFAELDRLSLQKQIDRIGVDTADTPA